VTTSSPIGRAIVALAALAVAGVTLVLGAAAQVGSASASANCVAVVVDFRLLGGAGGTVQTGCAQGDPSSGLKALSLAGFSYRPRPDGLICQIDSRPACTDTTSSRYWSYWVRAAGSSHWVYASEGPGTHNPKPGSTEGWVWQDGGRTPPPSTRAETICPQLAASPSPRPTKTKPTHKPAPASAPPTSGKTHAPASTPARTGSTSAGASTTRAPTSPASGSGTSSSGAPSSTSAAVGQPSDGPTTGAAAPDPVDQGGGGALGGAAGVALGSAVVLGIGAATFVRARRGRSA
jgi:hypothetical protein